MLKRYYILFTFFAATCTAKAQTAVKKDSSVQYDIHLSATAIFSGGNLQRTVTQNRFTGSAGNSLLQLVTENSYRYGRNFTRVVENDFLTRNYLRLQPGKKWYGFAMAAYENNYRRSIGRRLLAGAGTAYNFYRKEKDFLRISLAGAFETALYKADTFNISFYNGRYKIRETRAIIRFGGRHTLLPGRLVFTHDTWLMQGLRNTANRRWHSLLGVQVPVYKGLSFKTDFDYTAETVTVSAKNPFGYPSSSSDWVLSFGLSYDIKNETRK
jgi:Protein of unknown function, DUF481